MNKSLTLALPLALASSLASAEWFVQPKVGYEIRDFGLRTIDSDNLRISASIPGVIYGISMINSAGYYWNIELSGGNGEVSDYYPEDDYIERYDSTISAGYSLGDGLTVFGGWATSDTQIENQKGQANQPDSFQTISSGLMFGLSQTFSSNAHSVNLAAAIGFMSGTYESDDLDAEGSSQGFSGSLAYTYRTPFGLAVTLGVKGQNYEYSNMYNRLTDNNVEPLNESITSYFLKTSYTF